MADTLVTPTLHPRRRVSLLVPPRRPLPRVRVRLPLLVWAHLSEEWARSRLP
jgi:hypothetical protein